MKKYILITIPIAITAFIAGSIFTVSAQGASSLAGRILLQVEQRGEAWYVDPVDLQRYFLGSPDDAFNLMQKKRTWNY